VTWLEVCSEADDRPLLKRVRRCASFLCRLRGLTFRGALGEGEGLLLVGKRQSRGDAAIHMFFVFFPIGVVWLDGDQRVVDVQLARPFRPFYAPQAPAKDILEGPPSLVERVRVGDRLRFGEAADA
jgi:hypothetical protein